MLIFTVNMALAALAALSLAARSKTGERLSGASVGPASGARSLAPEAQLLARSPARSSPGCRDRYRCLQRH